MNTEYLCQPPDQLGTRLAELLSVDPPPKSVVIVSAFAERQSLLRLRGLISDLVTSGTRVRIVVGIDMDGTSKEALEEILSWQVDARVVKQGSGKGVFHPKIQLAEWADRAVIAVGSGNLTDGGLYTNIECSTVTEYSFPDDRTEFDASVEKLKALVDPTHAASQPLSHELIDRLVERGDVPILADLRAKRASQRESRARRGSTGVASPFGRIPVPSPPPMPRDAILETTREAKRVRRSTTRSSSEPVDNPLEVSPTHFYMTLPRMQGDNIPGEARIPLAAREIAEDFWGWRDRYTRLDSPRGADRHYWEWKPTWQIGNVDDFGRVYEESVRIYEYEESSDFRFYSRALVNMGADSGDIVRITPINDDTRGFECILARKGTPEYEEWITYCTEPVTNSDRKWGYS
jgi:hypothetical protein